MKFFCAELNKEFDTRKELFAAVKESRDVIVTLKRAAVKFSEPVACVVKSKDATKAEPSADAAIKIGDYIYPVINTTNWLDSHGDVHIDGLWDVSIKEQKNKLFYIINHELEIGKVIGYPRDVEAYTKQMEWSELGFPYSGSTQALIFKTLLTEKANKDALQAIIAKEALQNSVRMQYIEMTLCINDSDPDFKQEYANFYKYLALIANKEDAMERGYFWAITQAKIFKEGSAVLFGSNEATPILYNQEQKACPPEGSKEEAQPDPPEGSHTTKTLLSYFLN